MRAWERCGRRGWATGQDAGDKAGDEAGDETSEAGNDYGDESEAGELDKPWDGAGEQENAGKHCVAALSALPRTGHDAAIKALLSQGRATDSGGTSGCASDERALRLIGWAETLKDGMINRHRGV